MRQRSTRTNSIRKKKKKILQPSEHFHISHNNLLIPFVNQQVRWADVEERKKQTAARERGFVLGQTDWSRMTDLSFGNNALVQIRYIEGRENK